MRAEIRLIKLSHRKFGQLINTGYCSANYLSDVPEQFKLKTFNNIIKISSFSNLFKQNAYLVLSFTILLYYIGFFKYSLKIQKFKFE